MYPIILCDDVWEDVSALAEFIEHYGREKRIDLQICYMKSGEELVDAFEMGKEPYKLIFLDIYIKNENGIDIARKIRTIDKKIPIIILSTSKDFAIESYEVEASGYMLKPFSEEKTRKYLDKFLREKQSKRLAVKSGHIYRYLDYDDIRYIESSGHFLVIHLMRENLQILDKLGNIEEQLDDSRFLRCHQSYIVNMDFVDSIEKDFKMQDGTNVPVRVKDRKKMGDCFYQYFVTKNLE